jgi:hypothetical protein
VGNDKGVKSIFSGHWVVLLLLRKNARRSNRKAQVAKNKRFARITGKDCLVAYLFEDCSGGLKPQGPSEVKSIRPVLQGCDPITRQQSVATLVEKYKKEARKRKDSHELTQMWQICVHPRPSFP